MQLFKYLNHYMTHCVDYSIKTTHQYPEGFYKYLSNLAIVDLTT